MVVKNLVKHFPVRGGVFPHVVSWIKAVDGVSFTISQGETLGLVGESGCGKTTLGRTMLRLIEPTSGSVVFENRDMLKLQGNELKDLRRNLQIIFQDPYASLDPRMTIGDSIAEGLKIHGVGTSDEREARVVETLAKVGLESHHAGGYPHEFSGGQRQRIGIARIIALRPKLVIADEPVSALDVSIRSQVMNLLKDLQVENDLAYLLIAHDLRVIEYLSHRVAVMYLGKIVELAAREEIFSSPLHPYTHALLSAIPVPDPTNRRRRIILGDEVPSSINLPSGCRFHPRCPVMMEHCSIQPPELVQVSPGHHVACWRVE
jgi:peptide/nickel transport system ATP-binding protein/oligopeptide transport system ATP-binding protein